MIQIQNLIQLHQGQNGSHSFFYTSTIGPSTKNARVSLSTLRTIRRVLPSRLQGGVKDRDAALAAFLNALLPYGFLEQLALAGISTVEAWRYMAQLAFPSADPTASMAKAAEHKAHRQAERLAKVINCVSGGRKTPEALFEELGELVQHRTDALSILHEWIDNYGYGHGGYIIVGNRANRSTKKASAKAA